MMLLHDSGEENSMQQMIFDQLMQECTVKEAWQLRKAWRAWSKQHNLTYANERLAKKMPDARARVVARAASIPTLNYPDELPVVAARDEIIELIKGNQVVIIAGDTGSGKTTQLPKMCLEAGCGQRGFIGHTQPRRIAARSVADRIAQELGTELGETVGYKVRFYEKIKEINLIKLLTDGMLLSEMQQDRLLLQYDTIIIDEAHERSLNIDFLLGYLKQLLPKRPELKVIITSATIDPERFARFFNNAPVLRVEGRTYPVEVRYRPLLQDDIETESSDAICEAVNELWQSGPGDILVFLSGEREILDLMDALRKAFPRVEVLPLFSRLSLKAQQAIFKSSGSGRRIVLSTNVAETSLTVPGIRYVIDAGFARISRYSYRTKIQRLPIEAISQASANQRKGRCGRVADGICIRLYDELDFNARPEFTDPEVIRTNLSAVILHMANLGLGAIQDFPFLDAPDTRYINDGLRLLTELGAMTADQRLTSLGRMLARFPVDPSIGRMILAGAEKNALSEILIIASALSIQDPRERPQDKQQQADEVHRPLRDQRSDFVSFLKLWQRLSTAREELSKRRFRNYCKENFYAYLRVEEWHDVYQQLSQLAREQKLHFNQEPADYDQLHQAILTGIVTQVAVKSSEDHSYTSTRNRSFHIFPGSSLFKKGPKWCMAWEIVETARVYARQVASIDPLWVEQAAAHLVKREYFEPHWSMKRQQVIAYEKVVLYGVTLIAKRALQYGRIDGKLSREIFIRNGLVGEELQSNAEFYQYNKKLLEEVQQLEHKQRRRDIVVDDDALYRFYDGVIPEFIHSAITLKNWLQKKADKDQVQALYMQRQDLLQQLMEDPVAQFPNQLQVGGFQFTLGYHFEPGGLRDGVTATIPVAILPHLSSAEFECLVPGFLEEKVTMLIKAMPKSLRRQFIPAPDMACRVVHRLDRSRPLTVALALALTALKRINVPVDTWENVMLEPFYQMNFQIINEEGKAIAEGRDLQKLQAKCSNDIDQSSKRELTHRSLLAETEKKMVECWDFGDLEDTVTVEQFSMQMQLFPCLISENNHVFLGAAPIKEQAESYHLHGQVQLAMNIFTEQAKYLKKELLKLNNLAVYFASLGGNEMLADDLVSAVFEATFFKDNRLILKEAEFNQCLEEKRRELVKNGESIAKIIAEVLKMRNLIQKQLKISGSFALIESYEDIKKQLNRLIFPGFIQKTPLKYLERLPVYLKAMLKRLERMKNDVNRDIRHTRLLVPWLEKIDEGELWVKNQQGNMDALIEFQWMIEEYRVSIFAQELKTLYPISEKRLMAQWKSVKG